MNGMTEEHRKNTGSRAPRRTAMLVLFAFLFNLFGVNAALAGLPFFSGDTQTEQSKSQIATGQQSLKPCHHNHLRTGIHQTSRQSLDAVPDDEGLCCTNDNRSGELQTALRSKRDRDMLASTEPPVQILATDTTSIATIYAAIAKSGATPAPQLTGLISSGAAQFIHTQRLLN